jgi:hypothetical protein
MGVGNGGGGRRRSGRVVGGRHRAPTPVATGTDLLLAILALGLAALSPMLHETFLTRINQRLVWAALIAWSVVVTITELVGAEGTRRPDRGSRRPVRRSGSRSDWSIVRSLLCIPRRRVRVDAPVAVDHVGEIPRLTPKG